MLSRLLPFQVTGGAFKQNAGAGDNFNFISGDMPRRRNEDDSEPTKTEDNKNAAHDHATSAKPADNKNANQRTARKAKDNTTAEQSPLCNRKNNSSTPADVKPKARAVRSTPATAFADNDDENANANESDLNENYGGHLTVNAFNESGR